MFQIPGKIKISEEGQSKKKTKEKDSTIYNKNCKNIYNRRKNRSKIEKNEQ